MFPIFFGRVSQVTEFVALTIGLTHGLLALIGLAKLAAKYIAKPNDEVRDKVKTEDEANAEVDLIEKRAHEHYEQEKLTSGLLIKTGFYGPEQEISQLREAANKIEALLKLEGTIPVTVPLRFYVKGGVLHLSGATKEFLFGFRRKNEKIAASEYRLYIVYEVDGIAKEQIFRDEEKVHLHK